MGREDKKWTFAHEFGPSLGFDDACQNFVKDGNRVKYPYIGYRGNIMGIHGGTVWEDNVNYLLKNAK